MQPNHVEVWTFPTRIVFGAGAVQRLPEELERLGAQRPLVVSDPGIEAAGITGRVLVLLQNRGVACSAFTGLSSNPTEAEVEAGAEAYRSAQADAVIALGGGAAMDVAKLVAVRAAVSHPFEQLDDAKGGDAFIPSTLPPVLALPTTAGTGSEVGRAAVLTVQSTGRKTIVFAPSMLPRVALLDPELTLTLPPGPTTATAFDALSHCVEAYLAKGDHPLCDSIALGGVELIVEHLPRVLQSPTDVEARGGLMKAASMGAIAFQKGLGACHSLSHPLSAEFGVHHGLANALCLPAVVDFNEQLVASRVQRIARTLGAEASALACGQALRELRKRCDLPASLTAVGVDEQALPRLASLATQDGCHLSNPRPCSAEDFLELYRASL